MLSTRKRGVRLWCGVIPTAVLPRGRFRHSPARGNAMCRGGKQDGCAWLSSRRVEGARWWLLLDDDEYEIGPGEHGSNSVSAHAVSDHGLKSISLHQLKLPLLCRFSHDGCVVNQAGESMRDKNNRAERVWLWDAIPSREMPAKVCPQGRSKNIARFES